MKTWAQPKSRVRQARPAHGRHAWLSAIANAQQLVEAKHRLAVTLMLARPTPVEVAGLTTSVIR
jgi:hypothetical protein